MEKWLVRSKPPSKRPLEEGSPGTASAVDSNVAERQDCSSRVSLEPQASCAPKQRKISELPQKFCHDIGKFIGKTISDFDKYQLLTNHWVPPKNYSFPHSEHNKKGKIEKRYANQKYLDTFDWLVFSDFKQGFFCKYCPLFTTGLSGGYKNNVPLQKLVSQPLTSFSKLLGKDGHLNVHSNHEYHKSSVQFGKDFLQTFQNPERDISNQVVNHRLRLVQENRKKLAPIVESIIFLGRQNIPFRGHRDYGQISFEETETSNNEGNFRELLKFRVKSGDKELEAHLENASCRATYISKNTQNSLINACGEEILSFIIKRIKESGVYSIMFDETTDLSHQSQLTLIVRYVYEGNIREDFLQFLNPRDTENETEDFEEPTVTGVDIARNVISMLQTLDLNIENCVGISTDGCSVMTSEAKGAVQEIQKKTKCAVYSPCYNHALNLSISKASSVQAVRNSVGTIKEVIGFFNASSKRHKVLRQVLGHSLPSLCETRWVERHESILEFKDSLPKICEALEHISKWKDGSSNSKAKILCTALCNSEFIICVHSLSDVLSVTLPLSRQYQKETIDVKSARDVLLSTMGALKEKRSKCEEVFGRIFEAAEKDAENLGVELNVPRISVCQKNRCNIDANTPSDYYRVSVYIPLVEQIVEDLKIRFSEETLQLHNLAILLPPYSKIMMKEEEERKAFEVICARYWKLTGFNTPSVMLSHLTGEFLNWKAKWEQEKKAQKVRPKNVLEALLCCDKDIYPTIHLLLQILASLPVSTASAERSFSSLRRLKTWLRSTMAQERLVGLALLNIHRDIRVNVDEVITRFAKCGKQHRLEFTL